MPVRASSVLWSLAVLLLLANLVVWQRPPGDAQQFAEAAWQRWRARSLEERRGLVRDYRLILERPDSQKVLERARSFSRLPRSQQDALRALQAEWQRVLEDQTAARRRELLRVPSRAAAYFAFRILTENRPEHLAALAGMLNEAGRDVLEVSDEGSSAPE